MKEVLNEPARADTNRILTIPNLMSFARLLSVPVFVWLFVSGRENIAWIIYAAGAFSDFLDGYIARRTDQVSELGKILDPVADRVLIVALAIALLADDVLPWGLALAIILRDALIVVVAPILERRGMERMSVSFVGKSATAALLIGLTSLAYSRTTFPGAHYGDDVGLWFVILGAVLYWIAALMYAKEALGRLQAMTSGSRR
jgi:cardiolipin synthase (CMP-forming)